MDFRLAVRFKRCGRRPKSHGDNLLTTGTLPEHRFNNSLKLDMQVLGLDEKKAE
jgi:hypothetical protein